MPEINIKDHPELRHALAHMVYSMRALIEGKASEAEYEIQQMEGMVFWEDDEHMSKYVKKLKLHKRNVK